jgi:hydroxymethylglutaryl-CoA synthase
MRVNGIVAYGAYVPRRRVRLGDIAESLGGSRNDGTRAVASYDEDATSMAVEACRTALTGSIERDQVKQLYFATAAPGYSDKTNAAAIHAAVRLRSDVLAVDMVGAVRSGFGALVAASQSPVVALAVLSDLRTGLPGGPDESQGGDAAAAFIFANDDTAPVVAEVLSVSAVTEELLDRWRRPGSESSRTWEARFAEQAYVSLIETSVKDALESASLVPSQVQHLVIAGLHPRIARRVAELAGIPADAVVDDLSTRIGNPGTAQAGVVLADVLDRAEPKENILVVVLGDGVGALMLRTTTSLIRARCRRPVSQQIATGTHLPYSTFLTWRGHLDREPPRRPDPASSAAPPAWRRRKWKFGFVGSQCLQCGTRSLPPAPVCLECHTVGQTKPVPMADVSGTVATYTVDRLAYTPNPPMLVAIVDFDGGGRFRCEVTDAAEDELSMGMTVEMTFRRTATTNDVHNYFWKARPALTTAHH